MFIVWEVFVVSIINKLYKKHRLLEEIMIKDKSYVLYVKKPFYYCKALNRKEYFKDSIFINIIWNRGDYLWFRIKEISGYEMRQIKLEFEGGKYIYYVDGKITSVGGQIKVVVGKESHCYKFGLNIKDLRRYLNELKGFK